MEIGAMDALRSLPMEVALNNEVREWMEYGMANGERT